MQLKDIFLRIKSMGVVSDAWLMTNRGDHVQSQLGGSLNKTMVTDISTRTLQLLSLQGSYIGPEPSLVQLVTDETLIVAFDLGPLVLVCLSSREVGDERLVNELSEIAGEIKADTKFISRYEKKDIERRELISDRYLDEKAVNLLAELKKSA